VLKTGSRSVIFQEIPIIWFAKSAQAILRYNLSFVSSKRKKEITEGNIYSPVDKFAERAKLLLQFRPNFAQP